MPNKRKEYLEEYLKWLETELAHYKECEEITLEDCGRGEQYGKEVGRTDATIMALARFKRILQSMKRRDARERRDKILKNPPRNIEENLVSSLNETLKKSCLHPDNQKEKVK